LKRQASGEFLAPDLWRTMGTCGSLSAMATSPHDTVVTLQQRSARARAAALKHAEEVREQVVALVRGQLPAGARAWLVGSLAWGGFGERSDVDLVLDGVSGPLATAIEIAVTKAADVEVDLLALRELSPSFQSRVKQEGFAIHGV
jgi:predicted nucleotidyltransferase